MKKILFTCTLLLSLLLTSCIEEDVNLAIYKVSCSSDNFQVTYDSYNGVETKTITKKNWSTTFSVNTGENVFVSAISPDSNATITAEIYYEGKALATKSSSEGLSEVTVSAIIP